MPEQKICPVCEQPTRYKSGVHKGCEQRRAENRNEDGQRQCHGCGKPVRRRSGWHKGCKEKADGLFNSEGQRICEGCGRPTRLKSGWHKACKTVAEAEPPSTESAVEVEEEDTTNEGFIPQYAFGFKCPIKSHLTGDLKQVIVEFDDDCPTMIECMGAELEIETKPASNKVDDFRWSDEVSIEERQARIAAGVKRETLTQWVPVIRESSPCYTCTRGGIPSVEHNNSVSERPKVKTKVRRRR